MSNLIGQSLGRYHIIEQLGEGGMATVYKGYDTRLETDVAVKVIRTENLTIATMERAIKRFEREAKALARLTHPNIVKVTDFGEHEGKPYLVMEYLPGGTLKQRLGKPMPWQEAVRLLIPIAEALDFAHSQNMIHRDVKPSNILLTQRGQPMLTDFGIAKILDVEETADLTGTGMGIGTPEYMAPEQWTGKSSTLSDQYALGVILYEMVTGRKPYTADTPAAILLKQATEPLPRPNQFTHDLPESIEKLLLKALARNLEDRYASMGKFTKALENVVIGGRFSADSDRMPATNVEKTTQKPHIEKSLSEETLATVDQLEDDTAFEGDNGKSDSTINNEQFGESSESSSYSLYIIIDSTPLYLSPSAFYWEKRLMKGAKLSIIEPIKGELLVRIGKYGIIEVMDEHGNKGFVAATTVSLTKP